jgi:hypothetical protein
MSDDPGFLLRGIPEADEFENVYEALASPPAMHDGERLLPPVQRRRIVVRRLSNYFQPGMRHLRLYEGIIGQIRDGYEGRARTMDEHDRRIREVADLHQDGKLIANGTEPDARFTSKAIGLNNTSRSSVLLGTPGMGKSLTVEEILRRIPEVISHRSGTKLDQICWMKLDCPHKSSVKSLCIDFFSEVDRILRFDKPHYLRMYAALRSTEEQMMSHMALVANLHALGLLVIDEVQHLAGSDGHLLRFLVTLINRIGVPVMLIGTTDAVDVIGDTARLARRGVGQASAIWERYDEDDPDWTNFLDDLWQYQWTAVHTELGPELRDRIYHHTQGIIDLAVKLFMLAQMRAIRIGAGTGREERITEKLLDAVAKEEMALVRPLVEALRTGMRAEIRKYKDLTSLSDAVAKVIRSDLGAPGFVLPRSQPKARPGPADQDQAEDEARFAQIFRELGIAADVGKDMLADIKAASPEVGFFQIVDLLREALKAPPKKARSTRGPKTVRVDVPMPEDDLRRIVADGGEAGSTPYMSLTAAGLAGPVSYFRAAA